MEQVNRNGGVLEHPANSLLIHDAKRGPGSVIVIDQIWFGHRARKRTALYVVGLRLRDLPPFPLTFDQPRRTVELMGRAERERTPPMMAQWLVDLAASCH